MSNNIMEEEKRKEDIIEQNYFKEKTRFEKVEDKIKETLFGVLNILLKFEKDDFSDEVIDLLNETCQFLYYPFYDPMGYLWKKKVLFSSISKFLSYFQTVVFFNNTELYILFFYILMAVVLGVVVDVGYVAYSILSKNKSGTVWPMRLLRSVVSYIVTVLFNPMVEYFLAILECSDYDEEGNYLGYYKNYNVDDMNCWTNVHFSVMCVEGILITLIFVLICTVVMTIFYEQKTSMEKEDAKTSSYADLTSLFVKIILILIYSFLVWTKDYHWIVVPATTLTCFLQFYVYWTERPFYNEKTNLAFFIHTGIVFYSTVVLLLLKILENAAFDGGIYILFIGGFMVSYIIITQKDKRFKLLLMNINKFSEGNSVFKQIRYFLELVDNSHKDRRSNILLKGYIYVHEESCTNSECPLKRYLQEIERHEKTLAIDKNQTGINSGIAYTNEPNNKHNAGGITNSFIGNGSTTFGIGGGETTMGGGKNIQKDEDLYLYQYVMNMYQNGISKFSLCTSLRINYSFFLMERMNNKKKALTELKNCEKYNPSFEEEFIIFRYDDKKNGGGGGGENEGGQELDVVANLAYSNHSNMFKEGLLNISLIYSEFWSLLKNNTQKSDEDLVKMNEYGEKLNKLLEVVKDHFAEMEKLKYNDKEALKLYANFYQDILNDKSKAKIYRERIGDDYEQAQKAIYNNNPADTSNENIDYIFLAGEGSQIGKITKCSPNLCSLLGYTPEELLGKNINFIMPEIFHSYHDKLLMEKASRFKTQMTQNVRSGETTNHKSNFKEIFVIAKNKLNQAVPLSMKVTLIYEHDNEYELSFIGRVYNQELYENFNLKNPTPGVPAIINFNMKVCYVLTNLDFIVQYYTPNANNFLGFKVGSNGNIDITKNITELGNNDDNLESKNLTKGEILCRRYCEPKPIIWKTLITEEVNNENMNTDTVRKWDMKGFWSFSKELSRKKEQTDILEQTLLRKTQNGNPFLFKRQRYKEDSFKLSVKESSIKGTVLGYIFRFEVYDNNDEADVNGFDDKVKDLKKQQSMDIKPTFIPEVTRKFGLVFNNKQLGYCSIDNREEEEEEKEIEGDMKEDWHEKLKELAKKKIEKFRQKQREMENTGEEDEEEEEEDSEIYQGEDEENEESDINYTKGGLSKGVTLAKQTSMMSNEESGIGFSRPGTLSKNILIKQESFPVSEFKKDDYKESSILNENPLLNNNIDTNNAQNQNITLPQQEKKVKFEFDYYHVKGLNNMRFLIYDFKKGRLIDVPKIKRESQVEYKKKEGIPNFIGGPPKEKVEKEENEDDEETENETAEVKRIEYALQKEQFQPEIVKLKWISFCIYIALMAISIILLYLIISDNGEINENILIINNSRILQTDLLLGLYYIRELTLLSMNYNETIKYKTYLYNKEYMISNITNTLNELFDRSSLLQKSLESTLVKWSQNRNNILINTDVIVNILNDLDDKLEVIEVKTKAFSAITELLGNLFEVINSNIKAVVQTNSHVYFYTTNLFNPVLDILRKYMDNLIQQLDDSIAKFKISFLLVLIFSIIILIIGGITLKIILDKISRRKSGYLEVFFQIDDIVCEKAFRKCEAYIKMLIKFKNNNGKNDDSNSENSDKDNYLKNSKTDNNNNNNENEDKKKKIQPSKAKVCINIKMAFQIGFLFLFIFLYYLIVIIIYENNLDNINHYTKLYDITSTESIEYQSMFDILREYFFDHKAYSGNNSFNNMINLKLLKIYEFQKDTISSFIFDKLPSKFKKKYLEVTSNDLCPYAEELFQKSNNSNYYSYISEKNYECHNLTENSTQYGLDLLISYYLEELRVQKNCFDQKVNEAKEKKYVYNNTLFDIYRQKSPDNGQFYSDENNKNPNFNVTDYIESDPFNIFNDDHIFQLSMIRRYFLLPIYNDTLNEFYMSIKNFWDTSYDIFLAVMVVLLLIPTTFYLAYWIPTIYSIDEDIYKTKNMLSIIPKDVLATIPGINKLLNLGNITLFSGVWNQSEQKNKKNNKLKGA